MVRKMLSVLIISILTAPAHADNLYQRPWYTRVLEGNSFLNPIKPINVGISSNLNFYRGDFLFDERHENPERNQICIDQQRCSKANPTLGFGAFIEANLKLFTFDSGQPENRFTIGAEVGRSRLFYGGLKGWTKQFKTKYECNSYVSRRNVRTSCGYKTISNKIPVYKHRLDSDTYGMIKVGVTSISELLDGDIDIDEEGEGFMYVFITDRDFVSNGYGGTKDPTREYGVGVDFYSDNTSLRLQWAMIAPDSRYKGRLTVEMRFNF